jgi:hypothetical protein
MQPLSVYFLPYPFGTTKTVLSDLLSTQYCSSIFLHKHFFYIFNFKYTTISHGLLFGVKIFPELLTAAADDVAHDNVYNF